MAVILSRPQRVSTVPSNGDIWRQIYWSIMTWITRDATKPLTQPKLRDYCYLFSCNCTEITMTSYWARWRIKLPASRLFSQPFIQAQIKETSKLPITGLCAGNSPVTGEFPQEFPDDRWIPAQMASNAENVSIRWLHHGMLYCYFKITSKRCYASSNGQWANTTMCMTMKCHASYWWWCHDVEILSTLLVLCEENGR